MSTLFVVFIIFSIAVGTVHRTAKAQVWPAAIFKTYLPIVYKCWPPSSPTCAMGPLVSGQVHTGYPSDRHVYYFIDLYVVGSISVTLSNYQAIGQLVLRRDDPPVYSVVARWWKGGSEQAVTATDLAPGRYFVHIYTSEGFNTNHLYSLTTVFTPPLIMITHPPPGTVQCANPPTDPFCRFEVRGTSQVKPLSGLQIYVFVFPVEPPGDGGWYLQKPQANLEDEGVWQQSPTYIGSTQHPARTGDTLDIRAAIVSSGSTYDGTPLENLPPDEGIDPSKVVGLIKLSNTVRLIVQR